MTPQEMFNAAYIGVMKQGRKSTGNDGGCAYRGDSGCKCAAGFLIPDEHYYPSMEGSTIEYIELPYELSHIRTNMNLVENMQCAHDKARCSDEPRVFVDYFKERMTTIAKSNNLTVPAIKEEITNA